MTETTSEYCADPNTRFVALIEDLPYADFARLPDHPAQRQTALHAANLLASGVLTPVLDQHREVGILLICRDGITLEQMGELHRADPAGTIAGYGVVLNGDTRRYLWQNEPALPPPPTVRASIYTAAERDSAVQAYNAIDSLQAVKGRKHVMQSTLNVAGLVPSSKYMIAATSLASALDIAVWVLYGAADEARKLPLPLPPGGNDMRAEMHRLLPHLVAVERLKPALIALDELDLSTGPIPIAPPAFVGAYLSILHRDPKPGHEFLGKLQDEESGQYGAGTMDAFYAIRKVGDYLFDPERRRLTKPQRRSEQALACVLNCFEKWLADPEAVFKADDFKSLIGSAVLRRFNPVLRREAARTARRTRAPAPAELSL